MLHFTYTDTCPDFFAHQHSSDLAAREEVTAMAQHLLAAADRYGLDRLKPICEDKLYGGVDVGTVATTLALADQLHCSQLKKRCIEFILASLENLDAVMATEGYRHLMASCPLVVNGPSQGCH
jgi:speckle-type POZ protein